MSENLTAEEKATQIFKQTESSVSSDDLTDLDELNIIQNKGIEYVLHCPGKEDLPLYIAPLKVDQYRPLFELQKEVEGLEVYEQLERSVNCYSRIFNIPVEVLSSYLDAEDVKIISGLLVCGMYEGKKLFSKKKFKMSGSMTLQSIIGKGRINPPGLPTT
jgi:hypothetical protein